ncbi:PIR protein [Plasmodium vivax]|uniref:VIR protein n=1 Tax=Plasmodium vivax TaxID=5855 RepID=A0A565A789_PLAVI|nr:PIR protein [Plasmodium vivax]
MQGQRRFRNNALESIIAFQKRNCISDYYKIKIEIEKDIEDFNKRRHNDFYKKWIKLYDKIIQKNNEIKHCVNKGHVTTHLINLDNIKNFTSKCPKRDAPTCRNSSPSQVMKSPVSKKNVSEESCKASKGCNKAITATELEKGKSKSRSPEGDPKTIESPRADSTSSSREKALAQRLSVIEPSKENTFETPPIGQPLQPVTAVESYTGDSSQVRVLDEITPQSKIPLDETHGANTTSQQSNDVTVSRGKDGDGQTVATNTHGPESAAQGASLHHNHLNGYRISASTGDLSSASAELDTRNDNHTGNVTDLRSASAELDTRNDNHTGNVTTNSESPPVKTPCTEASSDQASGSETLCYKRDDNELDISTGYILDKVHKMVIY